MSSKDLNVIILAAGKGTRMNSQLPKVAHQTLAGPMISTVLNAACGLKPKTVAVVTGFKREVVEQVAASSKPSDFSGQLLFAVQDQQLGTGHAVKVALDQLKENFVKDSGSITLILYGDTPLLSTDLLKSFLDFHSTNKNDLSIITANATPNSAYGRIIRSQDGSVSKIIERKDCSEAQALITEVNSGIYLVDTNLLIESISKIKSTNAQKEYYLTDIVEIAVSSKKIVKAFLSENSDVLQGVNSVSDLSLVNRVIMNKKCEELLISGVQILDPNSVYIEPSVQIGQGSIIGPNTQIKGSTVIGQRVTIEGSAFIVDSQIGDDCSLKFGLRIEKTTIKNHVSVGPFAHLRPDTILEDDVKIGNFVETKKAHVQKGAKANHLTYLGDASIGQNSNIGAGTITCNYDGVKKSKTTIGKDVFIGSNSSLVAPVIIEDGATVGAGSVITKTIQENSLAFTRAPLTIKKDYRKRG
jgi:bifunctional UDP-N-acetylglucosamine pyrophosphorylase/glucosamine-1-phosphate N-acetyltransferase